MRDLGRSLVKTHDYKNAMKYYDDSLNNYVEFNSTNIIYYYEIATDFVNILFKLSENQADELEILQKHLENFIERLTNDIKAYDSHKLKRNLAYFKFTLARVFKCLILLDKNIIRSHSFC